MPWKAISYVSSGITLIAFIVAVAAWVIRAKLLARERMIHDVPEGDRARLVERELEFFDVDTNGLTDKARYGLALRQIDARAARFKTTAIAVVFIAFLAATVTIFALWQTPEKPLTSHTVTPSTTPANTPTPPSTPTPSLTMPQQVSKQRPIPAKSDKNQQPAPVASPKPSSIQQSMSNSPGGIQNVGGTVTVNQGPPSRNLTAEQQKLFTDFLRGKTNGTVNVSCVENSGPEACVFARQLVGLLRASGWTVSFMPMMAWGDPDKPRPELYIKVNSRENAPAHTSVLQQALKAVGHDALARVDSKLAPDVVQLTVSTKNQ